MEHLMILTNQRIILEGQWYSWSWKRKVTLFMYVEINKINMVLLKVHLGSNDLLVYNEILNAFCSVGLNSIGLHSI